MIELLLCSIVTIWPDYLFRRYAQGKRIGRKITLYSVWYEVRWGITACTGQWLFLHMVDAVGVVHAAILRIQALLLPVQTRVFVGH